MRISVPVYFESQPKPATVRASLLFVLPGHDVEAESPLLEKATARLRERLLHLMEKLKSSPTQELLKRLAFCPDFSQHTLNLNLVYRKRSCPVRLLVIQAAIGEQRLGFLPCIQRWFDLAPGDSR
jgi:hypothetical protein